ncbi:helix-turn-helix domain-containing protein [Legionella jamestowniensis]|uniref:Putative DNA-binding transcriptional regulator n=1 Tax=Legionella jamestowniensis TaxID=455 RepID=A0A0W0UZF7_9GAMM|nr:helix-turn-helix domain-containing protein [Legionella jamestowniensis]KTD13249.1 putative DNA-binding transcriptional regulator [Legionella jamestowniensis]SFL78105.1 Helix-turn-helix [Legionella jamestowniensis DSM 19215]
MTPDEIAELVRYCRKRSGLTQKELALYAGVGKTVIYDIENRLIRLGLISHS